MSFWERTVRLVGSGFVLAVIASGYLQAQVDTAWVRRYNGPGNGVDRAIALKVDGAGDVIVTGQSLDSLGQYNFDYATVKYNASGARQWIARYNGQGNGDDEPVALAVDGSGNVYVTGYSYGSGDTITDYATIKYNSSGIQQWVAQFNGGHGSDQATALAVDGGGNVYVTGQSYGFSGYQYATVKYNSSGVQQWVATLPSILGAIPYAIGVDGAGNVYVTGTAWNGDSTGYDYATVKYDASGAQQWVVTYDGGGPLYGNYDYPTALVVDDSANVYVTGYSPGSGTNQDYATVKYDTWGSQLWAARYNGPANGDDAARSLAVDGAGNVYVTGNSPGPSSGQDYATVKYNASGARQWAARYNGPGNGDDRATSLGVDGAGNVYVTGYSDAGGSNYDYATVKYDSSGNQQWVARYNGPGNTNDEATSLGLDGNGNVFVTGWSFDPVTNADFATIKYVQSVGVEEKAVGRPEGMMAGRWTVKPNPFISFAMVPGHKEERFTIYDICGRKVGTDPGDRIGERLSPGVYFLKPEGRDAKPLRVVKVR